MLGLIAVLYDLNVGFVVVRWRDAFRLAVCG